MFQGLTKLIIVKISPIKIKKMLNKRLMFVGLNGGIIGVGILIARVRLPLTMGISRICNILHIITKLLIKSIFC